MDDEDEEERPGLDILAVVVDAALSRRRDCEPSCCAISNDSRRRGARRCRGGDDIDGELNDELEDDEALSPGEYALML